MARCGCATEVASGNPTVVEVEDSPTIELGLTGVGTPSNPLVLSAEVKGQGTDKFLDAFRNARQVGMTVSASLAVALAVGKPPLGFDPDSEAFVPLALNYVTGLMPDFTHVIGAAANVYEKITELPDLTIVEPGVYLVSFSARTSATIPLSLALIGSGTVVALHRNNVLVPNSEARGSLILQGTGALSLPGFTVQGTAVSQSVVTCAANDKLSLYAKRSTATVGTINSVNNDDGGRAKITAVRLRL